MTLAIENYLRMLIMENDWSTTTIFAPGMVYRGIVQRLRDVTNITDIYDKDEFLDYEIPYTIADVIFDDVKPKGEVIVTIHGEKMFPPPWKFKEHNHILIINMNPNNGNCTTIEQIKQGAEECDIDFVDNHAICTFFR